MSVALSFRRVYSSSKDGKYACIFQNKQKAEAEDHWDKDISNQFCGRHLFLILRWFQDIGTYPH